MRFLSHITALLMMAALAACGGGGGSPGAVPGAAPEAVQKRDPLLSLTLQDGSGAATNSIGASGNTLLLATLRDPSGRPIPNQVIDVAAEETQVVFPEGNTGLTNASGVATIRVARAAVNGTGAGTLTATYNYRVGSLAAYPDGTAAPATDTLVTAYQGYQIALTNITLTNLDLGTSPLQAYGTRQVSVQANVNGAAASSSVQVSFSASCGQILPTTVTTNSSGLAVVSYSATDAVGAASSRGCGGRSVEISASVVGGAVITRTLAVAGAPATNMSFVSATPSSIFLANSGGPTQSLAVFRLVNALGEPLQGQSVLLSLKTLGGGIPKATIGTVGNTSAVTVTTDSNGIAAVPVFSGTVPTNVIINAALVSNPAVQTDSAVLTIASGRAAQARASLSVEEFAIEGANTDGTSTSVTMSLADRQGNPVPDGTAVNFVTEGGVMIPPVCVTGGVPGDSRCSVEIRSQSPRPPGGRVSILAYVAGEEDFVDANFNNVYDCGEAFGDLGTATRDDNENGAFDTGEFSVPRGASQSACAAGVTPSPQSGDGVWGSADVRRQAVVVFATSQAAITGTFQSPVTVTVPQGTTTVSITAVVGLDVQVADLNGNSMPTGSVIDWSALDRTAGPDTCELVGASTAKIPNSLSPYSFSVAFKGCTRGDLVNVKVTSPLGLVTSRDFAVP